MAKTYKYRLTVETPKGRRCAEANSKEDLHEVMTRPVDETADSQARRDSNPHSQDAQSSVPLLSQGPERNPDDAVE